MALGERILFLMDAKGITKVEIADAIHVHSSTFRGYINNTRQPSYDTLCLIADYLNTSCDFLLGYSSIPSTDDAPLSSQEEMLISMYRLLDERGQALLYEEVKLIWNHYKKQRQHDY